MKVIFSTIFILISNLLHSQTAEDFKLITGLKDTLFRGYENEIKIETKYDLSKLILFGESITLRKGNSDNIYLAKASSSKSKCTLTLMYLKGKGDTLIIKFPYTISNLTFEKIDRHNAALDRPPVNVNQNGRKLKIELLLPQNVPDRFEPIIISRNRKYALLGNWQLNSNQVIDLKTKKPIIKSDVDTILSSNYSSLLSNTGRYLASDYLEIYGDSIYFLRDLINHKYLKIKNSFEASLFEMRVIEFSKDDKAILVKKIDTTEKVTLSVYDKYLDNIFEFTHSTDAFKCASFDSENQNIYSCGLKGPDYSELLIEKTSISGMQTLLMDSLLLPLEPILVKIEFQTLIIGFRDPASKKNRILIYDLDKMKLVTEFDLPDGPKGFSFDYDNNYTNYFIDPNKKIFIYGIYDSNNIHTYFCRIEEGKFNEKAVEIGSHNSNVFYPIILENETLFGLFEDGNSYYDEQDGVLFWYDMNYGVYEEYETPMKLFCDGTAFTKQSYCDENDRNFTIQTYKYKRGKKILDEQINVAKEIPNETTLRYGTSINKHMSTSRQFGYFDLNLATLQLNQLHEFKEYQSEVTTNEPYLCDTVNNLYLDTALNLLQLNATSHLHTYSNHQLIFQNEEDGGLIFYNHYNAKNERTVRMQQFQQLDWIMYCEDKYYAAHFSNDPIVQFNSNGSIFPFENFDLKYNRPDIIAERLGYADSNTISAFHSAYKKRLKKMNFTEEMLGDDFSIPELKIENFENLNPVTDTSLMELKINIKDYKYKLDRFNIYINDVPIYGSNGIDLRNNNSFTYSNKIKIELSEGKNKIQLSVLNQAGAESYKETAYVTYKPKKPVQPNLYLVTIGDSKYSDSRYDLTYASKDATDIKNAFEKNSNSLYGSVFAYSYTDNQVTKVNILKLKSELLKAKRDDVVIITVAGHGVLDKNLDYYLATHDMDFSNPSEKGLPYEELESLLDGIAPLKKVLFLDACHSGEVDKEEVDLLATNTTTNSKVKFRNAGAGIQKKNLGLKTTSELMSELFTDLRRGTGATVISSAGGAEYAMESDEWKNGLFTYCLLHGLKDKDADENKDGEIWLSELQSYLRKEVTLLSNGAQQPTSRMENLSMDFRVW
jgi:uncharacterized caspase-like protein